MGALNANTLVTSSNIIPIINDDENSDNSNRNDNINYKLGRIIS